MLKKSLKEFTKMISNKIETNHKKVVGHLTNIHMEQIIKLVGWP